MRKMVNSSKNKEQWHYTFLIYSRLFDFELIEEKKLALIENPVLIKFERVERLSVSGILNIELLQKYIYRVKQNGRFIYSIDTCDLDIFSIEKVLNEH